MLSIHEQVLWKIVIRSFYTLKIMKIVWNLMLEILACFVIYMYVYI